jgi:hypothetical protein
VSVLGKIARTSYQAHRLERATRNPARFARNRAISKGLGLLGFWRMMAKVWR